MTQPNCTVCGRTPEHIAVHAARMRVLIAPELVGIALRTRWRETLDGVRDLACGFCTVEVRRNEAQRLEAM